MVKKHTQFFEKVFQKKSITVIILIFALYGCKPKRIENTFILDNIQYELTDIGVGYDVKNDTSLDLNKASFVASLHITNLLKNAIDLERSKFKLVGKDGKKFSLVTEMNGIDVSVMYRQKIEPKQAIDYMLTFAVPEDTHYNLHVISPITSAENVIYY